MNRETRDGYPVRLTKHGGLIMRFTTLLLLVSLLIPTTGQAAGPLVAAAGVGLVAGVAEGVGGAAIDGVSKMIGHFSGAEEQAKAQETDTSGSTVTGRLVAKQEVIGNIRDVHEGTLNENMLILDGATVQGNFELSQKSHVGTAIVHRGITGINQVGLFNSHFADMDIRQVFKAGTVRNNSGIYQANSIIAR